MTLTIDYESVPWVTPGDTEGLNRLAWRAEQILVKQKSLLEGKRILDLACYNGRLSYPCLALGAASVTGIEARQELIDTGRQYFAETPFASRMEFVRADLFDYLASLSPGDFDVILCLGFLYHTVRQVDFFRECKRLQPESIFIDTDVPKNYFWYGRKNFGKPPALFLMGYEDPSSAYNTIDPDGVVFAPTTSFLEAMFRGSGYDYHRIDYSSAGIENWQGLTDYKKGIRASYFATRISE